MVMHAKKFPRLTDGYIHFFKFLLWMDFRRKKEMTVSGPPKEAVTAV